MNATEEFDSLLTADERAFLARARQFAASQVAPHAIAWERNRQFPVDTLRAACADGLAGIEVPVALGGLGLRFAAKMRMVEQMAGVDFGFAFSLVNHHNAIARIADTLPATVAAPLVRQMLAGERIGATALSEPGAGSDFAEILTLASPAADGWQLSGAKRWITNAAVAQVFVTYAQTQPGARGKGIAGFVVDASRGGFEREPVQPLPGLYSTGLGGFRMDNHPVPAAWVLGGPGDGFKGALRSVNKARIYVAAMSAGIIDASLQAALAWGGERQAFGRPLLGHQGPRWSLADVATTLEALRLLVYRAASLVERNQDPQMAAAMAKKFAGDHCAAAVNTCLQSMGARGLADDTGLPHQLNAARAIAFADGSTEMMNERIGVLLQPTR